VQNPVAICANNYTFRYLILQSLKANFPPETPDTEQFILFIPMMEIKNSWIFYLTSAAPSFLLVIGQPFVVAVN